MKVLFFLVFIIIGLGVCFLTPLHSYLTLNGITDLQNWIRLQGALAPLIFLVLYIVAIIFMIPASLFVVSGGLLFGTLFGYCLNFTGGVLGGCICFWLSRNLGRRPIEHFLGDHIKLKNLDNKINKKSFYPLLYLRFAPIPLSLLNYALGLTQASFKNYFFASLIGLIPPTFAYTALGAAGSQASLMHLHTWANYRVWGPFVLIIVLTLIPKAIKKYAPSKKLPAID